MVFDYFLRKMDVFGPLMNEQAQNIKDYKVCKITAQILMHLAINLLYSTYCVQSPDPVTRSLVLAIGVCYHARLQDREDFEQRVAAQFSSPLALPGGAQQFRDEIKLLVITTL